MLKTFLNLFFLLLVNMCAAQDFLIDVQHFSAEDGLADNFVYSITQDDRGMTWIGTGNGLNRFDGKHFHSIEDETLSTGIITRIEKSNNGELCIRKYKSKKLLTISPEDEKVSIVRIENGSLEEGFLLLKSLGKEVFFKNRKGQIFHYDEKKGGVLFGTIDNLGEHEFILQLTVDSTLIIHDEKLRSIKRIDLEGKLLESYPCNHDYSGMYNPFTNYLFSIFRDSNEIVSLHEHVVCLNDDYEREPAFLYRNGNLLNLRDFDDSNIWKVKLVKDSRNYSWLAINNHLLLFNKDGTFLLDLSERISSLTKGTDWNFKHIFVDNKNRLWLGTDGMGLFLITVKKNPFQNYLENENKFSIRSINELNKNRLQVNTYQGIVILDKESEEILATMPKIGLAITKDDQGVLWNGTHGKSLYTFDQDKYSDQAVSVISNSEYEQMEVPFYDSLSNTFYVGTDKGVVIFHKENQTTTFPKTINEFKGLGKTSINFFYRNDTGLWIATENGLYLLKNDGQQMEYFSFPFKNIKHFHEDKTGDFWLATTGGGLIHWNRKENKINQFTTKNGLSHNVLYAVYEDNNNQLWLPSNNGLMCFDKTTHEVGVFHTIDGIPDQEFNTYSHYQAADGRLYFGGVNGFTAFFPDSLKSPENDAAFIVTKFHQFDFKKGGLKDKTKKLHKEEKIILQPGDKFFTIQFALLDYQTKNHIYGWKIKGQDDHWNFQKENTIRINALPYGKHVLQIKAKSGGGQWAKNELSIPILVIQPFYESDWFYWALGIGIILGVIAFYNWRVYRLRKNEAKLKKEVAERTKTISLQNKTLSELNETKDQFFSIIGHDLRGPLLSLRGLTKKIKFLIKNDRLDEVYHLGDSLDGATTNITKLLDNLLSWALVQRGKFPHHPKILNVQTVVNEVLSLYKNVAEVQEIQLIESVTEEVKVFVDKNALTTVLRNLVDNALKFTPKDGVVSISTQQVNDHAVISVCDTGSGIAAEQLEHLFNMSFQNHEKPQHQNSGTGLGLILCKELVEKNKGQIHIESQVGKGSVFTLEFPLFSNSSNTEVV